MTRRSRAPHYYRADDDYYEPRDSRDGQSNRYARSEQDSGLSAVGFVLLLLFGILALIMGS